jgi:uncharacterized protein
MIAHRALVALLWIALAGVAHAEERIFDTHVHIWNGEKSVKEYLAQVESAGLKVTGFGGIHMAVRGELAQTRAKNDELVALSKRYPLVPIASVHPYDGEAALVELQRLADVGVRTIKLHPHTQKFDAADERVLALCKRAGELGFVVLIDNANVVPGGDNQKLFNLALQAPKTHFVFTHMGALEFRFWNILKLARTAKNLMEENFHFDISGTLVMAAGSPIEAEFVWTLRNVGIENLLLGSDFPQMSLRQAVDALERLPLTDEEKRMIRWDNAHRLLGLDRAIVKR